MIALLKPIKKPMKHKPVKPKIIILATFGLGIFFFQIETSLK